MMKAEIASEMIRSRSHIERTGSVREAAAGELPCLRASRGSIGFSPSIILSLDYTDQCQVLEGYLRYCLPC